MIALHGFLHEIIIGLDTYLGKNKRFHGYDPDSCLYIGSVVIST